MEDENDTLANLYLNLKGKKKKTDDWITIAKNCQKLEKKYKSQKVLAEKLGVSYQLIRSILSLLELPEEIQNLIKDKKILFDAAQRINTIDTKKKQIEVAKTIAGLPSHKQREIILYAKRFKLTDLKKFKKRITIPRQTEKIHVAIIPLKPEIHKKLQKECKKKKSTIQQTIVEIIDRWGKNKN